MYCLKVFLVILGCYRVFKSVVPYYVTFDFYSRVLCLVTEASAPCFRRYALASTLTEYDFFGTKLRLVAWKGDPMDFVHDEVGPAQNQYRLDELRLPPKATFLDVGCSVGVVAMLIATWYPDARVVAESARGHTYYSVHST